MLALIILCSQPYSAMADTLPVNSFCPVRVLKNSQSVRVFIWQQNFDGDFDLAMAPETKSGFSPIVRLSFDRNKEAICHFSEIAVLKGGDWGWHVAWGSTARQALMIARVDGDAWVSSLPKKLASSRPDSLQLSERDGLLRLNYHFPYESDNIKHTITSSDEGRNWDLLDLSQ
jgi:hypothetical protein